MLTLKSRIPDASIKPEALADDIAQLAGIGAGGVEIHNYFGTPTVRNERNLATAVFDYLRVNLLRTGHFTDMAQKRMSRLSKLP